MTLDGPTQMGGAAYARKMCVDAVATLKEEIKRLEAIPYNERFRDDSTGRCPEAELGYARAQLERLEASLARTEATDA